MHTIRSLEVKILCGWAVSGLVGLNSVLRQPRNLEAADKWHGGRLP